MILKSLYLFEAVVSKLSHSFPEEQCFHVFELLKTNLKCYDFILKDWLLNLSVYLEETSQIFFAVCPHCLI